MARRVRIVNHPSYICRGYAGIVMRATAIAALLCSLILVAGPGSAQVARQTRQADDTPKWAEPAPDAILQEAQGGVWLVLATALDGGAHRRQRTNKMLIKHVYCGPAELSGRTFVFDTVSQGLSSLPTRRAALKEGEEGIFSVALVEAPTHEEPASELVSMPDIVPWFGYQFPATATTLDPPADYQRAQEYAHSIERLCQADHAQQLELLHVYAGGDREDLGVWAVDTLAKYKGVDSTSFFYGLLNQPKLTIGVKMAVDEVLLKSQTQAWSGSAARVELYRQLTKSTMNDQQADVYMQRLTIAARDKQMAPTELKELVDNALRNSASPEMRDRTATPIGILVKQGVYDHKAAFDILIRQIRDDHGATPIRAASAIKYFMDLSAEEVHAIRQLQEEAKNYGMRRRLQEIVDQASAPTAPQQTAK